MIAVFKSVIRFLVYSNIFIAVCTAAYTAKTSLLLYGNNGNIHVNILVFCATLSFYCFHRINKKKFLIPGENKTERHSWMIAHKGIYFVLVAVSSAIAVIELFYMPLRTWLVFIPVGLITIGYTFPVVPAGKTWKRLRDIYWLKTFWVSLAFSLLTTLLPVVFAETSLSVFKPEILFVFVRSFLFIFAVCIPFDIRDMEFDRLKGISTLPVRVGDKTSVYIAITLLLIFIALVCIEFLYFSFTVSAAAALFVSAVITILSLLPAKPERPALFFPLLFDGSMLAQWMLIVAFTHIG